MRNILKGSMIQGANTVEYKFNDLIETFTVHARDNKFAVYFEGELSHEGHYNPALDKVFLVKVTKRTFESDYLLPKTLRNAL